MIGMAKSCGSERARSAARAFFAARNPASIVAFAAYLSQTAQVHEQKEAFLTPFAKRKCFDHNSTIPVRSWVVNVCLAFRIDFTNMSRFRKADPSFCVFGIKLRSL